MTEVCVDQSRPTLASHGRTEQAISRSESNQVKCLKCGFLGQHECEYELCHYCQSYYPSVIYHEHCMVCQDNPNELDRHRVRNELVSEDNDQSSFTRYRIEDYSRRLGIEEISGEDIGLHIDPPRVRIPLENEPSRRDNRGYEGMTRYSGLSNPIPPIPLLPSFGLPQIGQLDTFYHPFFGYGDLPNQPVNTVPRLNSGQGSRLGELLIRAQVLAGRRDENMNYGEICSIPITKYKKKEDVIVGEEDNCAVCLKQYREGDDTKVLPCGHIFCPPCINKWLATKRTCPVCKRDAGGNRRSS